MQSDKQGEPKSPTHEEVSSQSRSIPTFFNTFPPTPLYQYAPMLNDTLPATTSGVFSTIDLPDTGASAIFTQSLNWTPATRSAVPKNTNTEYDIKMEQTVTERYSSTMYPSSGAVPVVGNSFSSDSSSGSRSQVTHYNIDPLMEITHDTIYTNSPPFTNTNIMHGNINNLHPMEIGQRRDIKMTDSVNNEISTTESTFGAFHDTKNATATAASVFITTEDTYTHQNRAASPQDTSMAHTSEIMQDVRAIPTSLESNVVDPRKSVAKSCANKPKKRKVLNADQDLLRTGGVYYLNDGPFIPKGPGRMSRSQMKAIREKQQDVSQGTESVDSAVLATASSKTQSAPNTAMIKAGENFQETKEDLLLDIGDPSDEAPPPLPMESVKSTDKIKAKKVTTKAPKKKTINTPKVPKAPKQKAIAATVIADIAGTTSDTESIDVEYVEPTTTRSNEEDATLQEQNEVSFSPATKVEVHTSPAVTVEDIAPPVAINEDIAPPAIQVKIKPKRKYTRKTPAASEPLDTAIPRSEHGLASSSNKPTQLVSQGKKRKSAAGPISYAEATVAAQAFPEEIQPKRLKKELSPIRETPMHEGSTAEDFTAKVHVAAKEDAPAEAASYGMNDLLTVNDIKAREDPNAREGLSVTGDLPVIEDLPAKEPTLVQDFNSTTESQIIEQQKSVEDAEVLGSRSRGGRNIRSARANDNFIEEMNDAQTETTFTELPITEQVETNKEVSAMPGGKHGVGRKRKLAAAEMDIIEEETNAQDDTSTEMPDVSSQKDAEKLTDLSGDSSKVARKRRALAAVKSIVMEEKESTQAIQSTNDLPIKEQGDAEQSIDVFASRSRNKRTATANINYTEKTAHEFIDWFGNETNVGRKKETTAAKTGHYEQNLMEIDNDLNITAPTDTKTSTVTSVKGKEKEIVAVNAEETPPIILSREPVVEKRGRGRAKAVAKTKPIPGKRQVSTKVPKSKAATAREIVYHELNEVEVCETEIASTSTIKPITVVTDEQNGEASATAEIEVDAQEEKEVENEGLTFLLTNKDSPLASADLKTAIPQWLKALPIKDQEKLAMLVPEPDQVKKKGKASLRPEFLSPSNIFFWEAVEQWQTILSIGGFAKKPEPSKTERTKDTGFKDDNYEAYWGERLKRDKASKQKASKQKASRAAASSTARGGRGGRKRGGKRA